LETSLKALAELIKPSGFSQRKILYLKEVAKFIKGLKGGIPRRKELLKGKGIGNETADR